MNESPNNGKAAGLVEACGGDAAALAAVLGGMTVRTFTVDRSFNVTRADGPLSALFGEVPVKPIPIPGGNLLDALENKDRDHWSGYLRDILADPDCPNCYSYARQKRARDGGGTSFVCIAPRIVRKGEKVK